MTEQYAIEYVRGHVEVFDGSGNFLFSADTIDEAKSAILELASVA